MSALVAGYESSDDEVQPISTSNTNPIEEDDESDDEKIEAQARTDAFGLKDGNGSSTQARKDKNGKLVVASAPDVLREVRPYGLQPADK